MIDVFSGRQGNDDTERSENRLSRLWRANDYRRVCRDGLKIVEFLQAPGRGRLLLPVFFFHLLAQHATALAGVSRLVFFLAEVFCDV